MNRKTIGFLLASLHTGASRAVLPGVMDAAEKLDVNLICFPGGRLSSTNEYENQRNVIYDFLHPSVIDGVISWSSSLGGVVNSQEINRFHQKYFPLPLISLAELNIGISSVAIDSYKGMKALLSHLIEHHHYRKIAFIRGPETHYYAQERYRAFLDTMQDYQLTINPMLVSPPMLWESGAEAINIFLDERQLKPGRDFDAIVAVSDLLALWAMKTLQQRGYQIPDDLTISGFNNSIEALLAVPPLTTVDLPFYEQGYKCVEIMTDYINGKKIPAKVTLPSRLVIRESCRCIPSFKKNDMASSDVLSVDLNKLKTDPLFQQSCLDDMAAAMGLRSERIPQWLSPVFHAFIAEIDGLLSKTPANTFLPAIENHFGSAMQSIHSVILWQDAISVLMNYFNPILPATCHHQLTDLLIRAKVLISELNLRSQGFWQWQEDRQNEAMRETTQALLTTFDFNKLADILATQLPKLGIHRGYLALYNNPEHSLENSQLILAFTETGRITLPAEGFEFQTRQLIPEQFLPQGKRFSFVFEPLFFQDKHLGFIIFDIGKTKTEVFEQLRASLSSTMQAVLLFQQIQQARLAAEKADQIKTLLLANVSHELRTPLNIILSSAENLKENSPNLNAQSLLEISHIRQNATHQLRVINDLLDLSRAQIDELDLCKEMLNPTELISEAFNSIASSRNPDVSWLLELPGKLPLIYADPVRLRQIILNLLSNAQKYTRNGNITLAVEISPPDLIIRVMDTGSGISFDLQKRIFEPFFAGHYQTKSKPEGIGLGLSITRHLVLLHGGSLILESQPGAGSTFLVKLPLPAIALPQIPTQQARQDILFVISSQNKPSAAIVDMAKKQHLEIVVISSSEMISDQNANTRPKAIAWDITHSTPDDWALVRSCRHYPHLIQIPFIFLSDSTAIQSPIGTTSFITKTNETPSLLEAIQTIYPEPVEGCIVIIDDDQQRLLAYQTLLKPLCPPYRSYPFTNGREALEFMEKRTPAMVLLDWVMPGMTGGDVLDAMRMNQHLRQVPVMVLSNKILTQEDVHLMERHAHVTFHNKGILSSDEAEDYIHRLLENPDVLSAQTSVLVKKTIQFLQQNYHRPISRWEVAEAIGVNEDYLSKIFNREINISPWDYLNRYRIIQAKNLLSTTQDGVRVIAAKVGIKDPAYFSRVFNKYTGYSPQAYRDMIHDGKAITRQGN